ncbi:MAG: PhzF family phenazine biosynthesis protein [Microbacterium sp.]
MTDVLPFRQVDVFGDGTFTGNPVAVVLDADDLSTEQMQRISVWTNLSECTFVTKPTDPGADYAVRIFSLSIELPFAGHPTLGTARAWLSAGGTPRHHGRVIQECGAGLVPVRLEGDALAFAAPRRIRSGAVDAGLLSEVIAILGVDQAKVVAAEWLDNGPGWVGVLLDSAETVLGLTPDASRHPGVWDIGAVGPAPDGADHRFELRAFFTDGEGPLREDPVTGSLNAAAAQWLIETGRADAPYTAHQGTALGRRGRISITRDDDGIWVGGRAEVLVDGTILV